MKRFLPWLSIVVLLIALAASTSLAQEPQATYRQDSIKPYTCDWPQKGKDDVTGWWCGAACLQAAIEWDWRDHHGDYGHYYTQQSLWDIMRDYTCSDFYEKGAHGKDIPLPLTDDCPSYGNGSHQVRKLNIAYDFGTDPHALAWTMWEWGPGVPHTT